MQNGYTSESSQTKSKVGLIILIVGIILIVSGIAFAISTATDASNKWGGVIATVDSSICTRARHNHSGATCKTTVSYEYRNESYTSSMSHKEPAKVPGNKITVRVNPKNPKIIGSPKSDYSSCIVFIVLGLCAVLCGRHIFLKHRNR